MSTFFVCRVCLCVRALSQMHFTAAKVGGQLDRRVQLFVCWRMSANVLRQVVCVPSRALRYILWTDKYFLQHLEHPVLLKKKLLPAKTLNIYIFLHYKLFLTAAVTIAWIKVNTKLFAYGLIIKNNLPLKSISASVEFLNVGELRRRAQEQRKKLQNLQLSSMLLVWQKNPRRSRKGPKS